MKITINRKNLVNTLKALKTLSNKGTDERFLDVVSLIATVDGLRVTATTGSAFVSVLLEAQIKEEGVCHSSLSKLHDLLKAVKDEEATLIFSKVLSVSTASGLKARLTETSKVIPIEALKEKLSVGAEAEITASTEGVLNLVDISNVFTPNAEIRWVGVHSTGEQVYGTVKGSEFGELESLPVEGQGDTYSFIVRPDHLAPILSFCGEHVRLSAIVNANGIYMVTDPDNDTWWAAVQRVDVRHGTQEN